LGIERFGKIVSLNSDADNCTGMGVISGFLAVVRIMSGPHVKDFDPHWRIRFFHILQEVRPVCKTRNHFIVKHYAHLLKSDTQRELTPWLQEQLVRPPDPTSEYLPKKIM